jgi:hypothetical protein
MDHYKTKVSDCYLQHKPVESVAELGYESWVFPTLKKKSIVRESVVFMVVGTLRRKKISSH